MPCARIGWKYALSLELTDPGFHFSVLTEFRARLVTGDATYLLLDAMLERFKARGLVKPRGKQRTDSTHVLGAVHGGGMAARCVRLNWQFGWSAYGQRTYRVPSWHGSLVEDKRDGTGLVFRRSRYLDPNSGQFTQEDPIGLAGGLNLYGFAKGDPVNFSDPFGLCPRCMIWWMTAGGPAVAELGALLTDLYVTRATGGGLAVHEALGGHTIKEHVARGIIDLTSRLASNSKLKAASSFPDKETAGRAIAAGLRAEAGDIAQWLAGSDKVFAFTHDVGRTIGYTLDRGATQFRDVSAVRIVLQRDARSSTGYLIKTAYPTP